MLTFAFWNLGRRPLKRLVANLAHENGVDVLVLAESRLSPTELLLELNRDGDQGFRYPSFTNCSSIQIFVRFSSDFIQPVREAPRYTIRRLSLPGVEEILVVAVHMPSKLHQSETSQSFAFFPLASDLKASEIERGHTRSLLLGDFNSNPFEPALVAASGLNGVMSRDIAGENRRLLHSIEYDFLYNPMWSLLGDASPGPPGTCFYRRSEQVCYYWNMFDQVMLRPAMMKRLPENSPTILTEVRGETLLGKTGRPNPNVGSDHLPIVLGLDL